VPLGIHRPEWVDDDRFDIDRHVLRSPFDDLDQLVSTAMSAPLERTRPLWECWIEPELTDGRLAVVGKVHHCMVDGLAAVELAALLLDPEPDAPPTASDAWRPAPGSRAVERLVRGVVERGLEEARLVTLPARIASSPARAAGAASRAAGALARSFERPATPIAALNRDNSSLRHVGRLQRPIADLQRIKSRFETTLNDVVLAVCAGAMRKFLADRGEAEHGVRAMVPAATRDSSAARGLGNGISFLFLDLPVNEDDPVERLAAVNRATRRRKRDGDAEGGATVLDALGYAPQLVQRLLTRVVSSPRTFNLVVSNIPGPREPLWMLGCRLREAYPVVPLAEQHALAIGVTSIGDRLCFGLYADRKTLPDVDRLASLIDTEIDALLALSGERHMAPVGAAPAP
jgi:diacylglycerol O-acyltransferase